MSNVMSPLFQQIVTFVQASRSEASAFFKRQPSLLESPGDLFDLNRLFSHLQNPLLGPDWVQVVKDGQNVPIAQGQLWKTVQRRKLVFLDKSDLNSALLNGASLVLEGLDILDPTINDLVAQLDNTMPCALSNCEAFFSRQGNEAYGGHRDSDDVLVIQISGVKRWRVYQPQQRRYVGNSPLTEPQMGQLAEEFDMHPGDALFVRAGVPHRVQTIGDYSLHLSFDLIDRTPNIEQITQAANSIFNQGLAPAHSDPETVVNHYVAKLRDAGFLRELNEAKETLRREAVLFRRRIDRAHENIFDGVDTAKVRFKRSSP
jgi:hypothetical protein